MDSIKRTTDTIVVCECGVYKTITIPVIFLLNLMLSVHLGVAQRTNKVVDQPPKEENYTTTQPLERLAGQKSGKSADRSSPGLAKVEAFSSQQIIQQSALPSPGQLTAADLDGDGRKDLVAISSAAEKVVWYRNTSTGFSEQKLVADGIKNLIAIDAADFSGDSLADLSVATDHKVYYVHNQSGNFAVQELQNFGESSHVYSLDHADMNGDGKTDIITSTDSNYGLGFFKNKSDGFTGLLSIYTSRQIDDIAAGDVDSDGDMDLVYTDFDFYVENGKTLWHKNEMNSGASFVDFADHASTIADSAGAWNINIGDFDDNGEPDIVASTLAEEAELRVYNNFSGKYTLGTTFGEFSYRYGLLDTKDIDNDAVSEFVLGSYFDGTIHYFNKFYFPNTYWAFFEVSDTLNQVSDIVAADLNNDNMLEIAATDNTKDNISWYKNSGSSFNSARFLEQHTLGRLSDIVSGDFDGDGDPDLAVSASASNKINWYENVDGEIGPPHTITTQAYGVADLIARDLDNDQDPDLLAALADTNQVVWYENTGSGFSSKKIISREARNVQSVYTTDLNGDDLPEVFSASPGDSTIAGYENSASGFKSAQVISSEIPEVDLVYADDLDLDGDADILASYNRFRDLAWFENTAGGFKDYKRIDIDAAPSTIKRGNFDDDEQQELVIGTDNDQGGSIVVLDKTKDTVKVTQKLADFIRVKHLNVVDYDMDGDDDIIASTGFNNRIILIEQTVFGFSEPQNITRETVNPVATVTADINADGDPDLFSVSSYDSKVAMYENTLKTTPVARSGPEVPNRFSLDKNYPNPFNPTTRIQYRTPKRANVQLTIYNSVGREIAELVDGNRSAGVHAVEFDASTLASGVYFYRLEAGSFSQTRKMMLMK